MKIIERNLQSIGSSLLLTLPKEWTTQLKLKKGAKVKIAVTEQGQLLIAPEFAKQEQKRTAAIPLDDRLLRRFFREYFGGNEKITVSTQQQMTAAERKSIAGLVQRFMNVQIIDEGANSITLKVFRVEDLSIEECVNRMHYLCLGIMEELRQNSERVAEMEETLTRFYYMAVLQIRMFLTEGRYVGQEVSLVRAMDYRMVAEKIERIADILGRIGKLNVQEQKLFDACSEFYRKAFSAFRSNDYEASATLWNDERAIRKKYFELQQQQIKKKDIAGYARIQSLQDILFLSRQISSFAR